MPFAFNEILSGIIQDALRIFALTWWLVLPVILITIFWGFWMFSIRRDFIRSIKWVTIKVRTPQEILKTPKAMEQIFAAAHASYSFGIKGRDKYIKGAIESWHTFDIVGDANGIYFLISTPEGFRNTIESAIYSQYPEAEIETAGDYAKDLPSVIPNDTYDLFGTDFVLARDNAYPIRTYPYFESMKEEEKIDTMSIILEVMSRLKGSERIILQLLIRPTGSEWQKKAQKERDKLVGRKEPSKKSKWPEIIISILEAPFKAIEWPDNKEEKPEKPSLGSLSKGEQDVIKAIEEKSSKLGFESALRFIFVDEKANFSPVNISAVMGALRQLSDLNLNSIAPNIDSMTIARGLFRDLFKKRRVYHKKRIVWDNYARKRFPVKFCILNTEELATLYHFPSSTVKAPGLQAVEFKKSAPPSNLPTEK